MSKSKSKTPPRRQPRTQADCDRAEKRGQDQGIELTLTVMLYVLVDKFSFSDEQISRVSQWFNTNISAVVSGAIKFKELQEVLRDEYDWEFELV